MNYNIFDPSRGIFPPHIEHSALNLIRTELAGGNDAACDEGFLYVIGGGTLRIYDIHGRFADVPEPVGKLSGLGNTRQICVSGNTVCVTARENGLFLINVSDKHCPVLLCQYDTVELATGLFLYNRYAFVSCRSFGVEIIDISEPDCPRHVVNIRAGEVQSVFVDDGILYTGSWGERQIHIIDVHDVLAPHELAVIPLAGKGDGLCVRDGVCYAAIGHHPDCVGASDWEHPLYGRGNGMQIFDVSDPSHPYELSRVIFDFRYYYTGYDNWNVILSGNLAVLSHTFNGVFIYDVSDPASPKLIDHTAISTELPPERFLNLDKSSESFMLRPPMLPFDPEKNMYAPVCGIAAAFERLYIVPAGENLHIAHAGIESPEIPAPTPLLNDHYDRNPGESVDGVYIRRTSGQVRAVAYESGTLYAACGSDGIRAYTPDLHDCIGHYPVCGCVMDVRIRGGLLYAACGSGGFGIYRAENGSLNLIGQYTDENHSFQQAVISENGLHALLHLDDRRVMTLKLSDPTAPSPEICETLSPGLMYYRQLTPSGSGGIYYGAFSHSGRIRWYDLSGAHAASTPYSQLSLNFPDGVTGLADPFRALAVTGGGYVIFDIRDARPLSEYPLTVVPGTSLHGKPVVFDDLLVVSDRITGDVFLLSIRDPTSPALLRRLHFSGSPDLAMIAGNTLYLPLGHQGIGAIGNYQCAIRN